MKKCWLLFLVLSCTLLAQSKDWTQYVNPLMGTQSSFELSTGNILNFGRLLAEGTPKEVLSNPEVVKAYLGE